MKRSRQMETTSQIGSTILNEFEQTDDGVSPFNSFQIDEVSSVNSLQNDKVSPINLFQNDKVGQNKEMEASSKTFLVPGIQIEEGPSDDHEFILSDEPTATASAFDLQDHAEVMKLLMCPFCDRQCQDMVEFSNHFSVEHEKYFKCLQCRKNFHLVLGRQPVTDANFVKLTLRHVKKDCNCSKPAPVPSSDNFSSTSNFPDNQSQKMIDGIMEFLTLQRRPPDVSNHPHEMFETGEALPKEQKSNKSQKIIGQTTMYEKPSEENQNHKPVELITELVSLQQPSNQSQEMVACIALDECQSEKSSVETSQSDNTIKHTTMLLRAKRPKLNPPNRTQEKVSTLNEVRSKKPRTKQNLQLVESRNECQPMKLSEEDLKHKTVEHNNTEFITVEGTLPQVSNQRQKINEHKTFNESLSTNPNEENQRKEMSDHITELVTHQGTMPEVFNHNQKMVETYNKDLHNKPTDESHKIVEPITELILLPNEPMVKQEEFEHVTLQEKLQNEDNHSTFIQVDSLKENVVTTSDSPNFSTLSQITNAANLSKYIEMLNTEEGAFECIICKEIFINRLSLKAHRSSEHEVKKKNLKCKICHIFLASSWFLKKHIEGVHQGKKDHQCEICFKCFGHVDELKKHIITSHGSRSEIKCFDCRKHFTIIYYVTKHCCGNFNQDFT